MEILFLALITERTNRPSSEGMTTGSITAPHRRAFSGLALRPLSLCASQEIFTRAALGCCPSLIWGKEDGPAIPPLREVVRLALAPAMVVVLAANLIGVYDAIRIIHSDDP